MATPPSTAKKTLLCSVNVGGLRGPGEINASCAGGTQDGNAMTSTLLTTSEASRKRKSGYKDAKVLCKRLASEECEGKAGEMARRKDLLLKKDDIDVQDTVVRHHKNKMKVSGQEVEQSSQKPDLETFLERKKPFSALVRRWNSLSWPDKCYLDQTYLTKALEEA
jgi:hypothetical protein